MAPKGDCCPSKSWLSAVLFWLRRPILKILVFSALSSHSPIWPHCLRQHCHHGWKINFQTDQDYEIAKAKEIEVIERRRHEVEMKNGGACGDAVNTRSQFDSTSRMVKEKLGLRVPMSQDPSVVAERMLKDRLSAVAKQAADHADQLKMNGMDFTKKGKNNPNTLLKKEETSKREVSLKYSLNTVFLSWIRMWISNCILLILSFIHSFIQKMSNHKPKFEN